MKELIESLTSLHLVLPVFLMLAFLAAVGVLSLQYWRKELKKESHKERHIKLHKALDELFADYVDHHPDEAQFTEMPLINLITWSHKQTQDPTEIENR